jgi:hypothetical protein
MQPPIRQIVFAILVAVPSVLLGWVLGQGHSAAPDEAVAVDCSAYRAKKSQGVAADKGVAAADPDARLRGVFSQPIAGATLKGKAELYDEKSLFDYIDGAAPMYIERHFRKLAAAELSLPEGGEFTVDIYDMREEKNAESIFTAERSRTDPEVASWPGAVAGPRSFVFRHQRYYVKLTAFDAKGEAALAGAAREIRGRLQ